MNNVLFILAGVYIIGLHLVVPTFDPGTPRAAKIATKILWPIAMIYSLRRWKRGEGKFLRGKIR